MMLSEKGSHLIEVNIVIVFSCIRMFLYDGFKSFYEFFDQCRRGIICHGNLRKKPSISSHTVVINHTIR